MSKWQPIETDVRDGEYRLYGLWVQQKNFDWFEVHYLAYVDGQLLMANGDLFSDWGYEDLDYWAEAPAQPLRAGS